MEIWPYWDAKYNIRNIYAHNGIFHLHKYRKWHLLNLVLPSPHFKDLMSYAFLAENFRASQKRKNAGIIASTEKMKHCFANAIMVTLLIETNFYKNLNLIINFIWLSIMNFHLLVLTLVRIKAKWRQPNNCCLWRKRLDIL